MATALTEASTASRRISPSILTKIYLLWLYYTYRGEYGLSVQFLIDAFATLVMLASVTWFVDWMMAAFPAWCMVHGAWSEVFARGSVWHAPSTLTITLTLILTST